VSSPTARTLVLLRKEGWCCGKVEQTVPHTFIKRDLGGFIDIVAWKPGHRILAVQATSGDHVADRIAKIRSLPAAEAWMRSAGGTVEVWGWRKVGDRGKRKLWEARRVMVGMDWAVDR
jgi:hypothetical protein